MSLIQIQRGDSIIDIPQQLSVLPLRDTVIFPHMVIPLVVGRPSTVAAVDHSIQSNRMIALVSQKDPLVEKPGSADMFRIGVVGRVVQLMKLPNGLEKVLIEGLVRMKVQKFIKGAKFLKANIELIEEENIDTAAMEAAKRHVYSQFKEFVSLNRQIPDEVALTIEQVDVPRRLADFIVMHLDVDMIKKQHFLETEDAFELLVSIAQELSKEIEILNIEHNIEGKVKDKISSSQRIYYLQEQLRAIKKELGEDSEDDISDVLEYRKKVRKAKLPEEAKKKAEEEISRLENTPMMSPEATVIRTYLDWMINVPWYKKTLDNTKIETARNILDEDHYGLEKPKERVLEHLAVLAMSKKIRGPILCLVGPPGVGKTSLGKSIARALGRKFVRISLGGVRDEAEIRGHRRTYIGALPGRVIQSMKKAGTINPVFLLDEVDKMSTDFRGDPAAALLEVLDPEQNHAFSDHYLEVDYDLSKVLFITTANHRDDIPWPLLDRMELIELPGYLHQEKFEIARQFLMKKQMEECGIKPEHVQITDRAIDRIIERYTREAGVRQLERCIAKLYRKSAKQFIELMDRKRSLKIDVRLATKMLGVPPYQEQVVDGVDRVGTVVGLAWTPTGGDLLLIEAEVMNGKGDLTLTGHLGDVMQESARAALTAIRSRAGKIGFDPNKFLKQEVHVHFPEGAVPKDGPSAGISIAVALASTFSKRKVRGDVALTGEITLRGEILPIGGLREKLMAALRGGVRKVIIPERNQRELSEVPPPVKRPLEIITVKTIDEVLDYMLYPTVTTTKLRPKSAAVSRTTII